MRNHSFSIGRVAAIIAVGALSLAAQGTQTANMTGLVRTKDRAPLAGVTIRLASPNMQGTKTLTSDEKGRFQVRLLPPGLYTVEIFKDGFQKITLHEKLGIEQNFQPEVTMVATQGVTVEVFATNMALDKTDVKTATNYDLTAVDELPTINRTPETVAALSPGVTDNGIGGRIQVRGAMTSGNLNLVDGQNVADSAYNDRGVSIISDAVEEVQVITGAISAEYGNVDGGVVNTITRSGSNVFSGQLRYELQNPKWNALEPHQLPASNPDILGKTYTYSLGGPIIKDRLWFFGSYFRNNSSQINFISGGSADTTAAGAGASFPASNNEERRQIKLTLAVTQDHTLVAAFTNNTNTQGGRDYSGGDLNSLESQISTSGYYSLNLRSTWAPTLTSEIRYGQKSQALTAGAVNGGTPIYDDTTGLFYTHGIFNLGDGGDHRNNRTANAKVSSFWDGMGNHQTDMGIDWYRGLRRAANEQSATNDFFEIAQYNGPGASVVNPEDMWTFISDAKQAESDTIGLYANDKWSLNKNWNFQIGGRYDKYSAKDTSGNSVVSASGFSPRLGANWDILGDSVWLVKGSYSRYNSGVADAIAQAVTNAGNPTEINYGYTGPGAGTKNNVQPLNVALDPANYPNTPANIVYYANPSINVQLASNLHSPHVDEMQLEGDYSFRNTPIGDGFLRVSVVNKKWSDLFDYTQGNNGMVNATGGPYFWKVWENSPIATRKYKDMEVEAQTTKAGWLFDIGITWSDLEGNYQGEGTYTPLSGAGLSYFTYVNGKQEYDPSLAAPYGKLIGDVPLRIRGQVSKSFETALGKTSLGWIYRFDSGQHFNETRSLPSTALNADFGGAVPYGSNYTQSLNNTLGTGIGPAQAYFDMAITQDFNLFKVAGSQVAAFVKVNIQNLFNHQQATNYTVNYNPGNALSDPWSFAPGRNYTTNSSGNYNTNAGSSNARVLLISAGVKF